MAAYMVIELSSEIRAIFTSGYSPEAIAPHATVEPGALFIEKPYTPSQLASKVREALGQETPAGA